MATNVISDITFRSFILFVLCILLDNKYIESKKAWIVTNNLTIHAFNLL